MIGDWNEKDIYYFLNLYINQKREVILNEDKSHF